MNPNDPNQQATQSAQIQQQPIQPTPQDQLAATNQALIKKKKSVSQQMSESYSPAIISRALATVAPESKSPQIKVGGALNTDNYSGRCLAYVDDVQGNNTSRQPTAFADYQVNAQSGNIKTSGTPPKGARVYFAPTQDNPAGHIGIATGDGSFTGATTNQGIKTFGIKEWEKYTSQQYIGYAPPPKP